MWRWRRDSARRKAGTLQFCLNFTAHTSISSRVIVCTFIACAWSVPHIRLPDTANNQQGGRAGSKKQKNTREGSTAYADSLCKFTGPKYLSFRIMLRGPRGVNPRTHRTSGLSRDLCIAQNPHRDHVPEHTFVLTSQPTLP